MRDGIANAILRGPSGQSVLDLTQITPPLQNTKVIDAGGNTVFDLTGTNVASTMALGPLGLAIDVVRDYNASGSSASTTGSISAGSNVLTLAAADDFKNGQYLGVAGAGQVANPSATALTLTEVSNPNFMTSSGLTAADVLHFNYCYEDASGNPTLTGSESTITITTTGDAVQVTIPIVDGAAAVRIFCDKVAPPAQIGTIYMGKLTNYRNIAYSGSATSGLYNIKQSSATNQNLSFIVYINQYQNGGTAQPSSNTTACYLLTQISSGGGTTSLTLSASASNTVSSVTVKHNDAHNIRQAFLAANSNAGSIINFPNPYNYTWYNILQTVVLPPYCTAIGQNWGEDSGNGKGTQVVTDNAAQFIVGVQGTSPYQSSGVDKMMFVANAPSSAPALCICGNYVNIGTIFVKGDESYQVSSTYVPAMEFSGGDNTGWGGTSKFIGITGGNPSLLCKHYTEHAIQQLWTTGDIGISIIADFSDNMQIFHAQLLNNTNNTSNALIVIGSDNNSQSFGWHIGDLNCAQITNQPSILVNYNNISSGILNEPTKIDKFIIGNTNVKPVFSFGSGVSPAMLNIGIYNLQYMGFNVTQLTPPSATGSGNAIQNTNPFPVRIYQNTATDMHIIDAYGTDTSLPSAPIEFTLDPGAKVYYATGGTLPTTWATYGVVI